MFLFLVVELANDSKGNTREVFSAPSLDPKPKLL